MYFNNLDIGWLPNKTYINCADKLLNSVEKINRSSTDLILWLVPLFQVPVPQDHLKDTKQKLFKEHFFHDCHPAQNLWKVKDKAAAK